MLYAHVDAHKLRLLYLKKSLLGQYEASFFDKNHTADLLRAGEINNLDLFASAIKEGLTALNIAGSQEVTLILPQDSFDFFTFKVPGNYSNNALTSFVKDRVRNELATDMTEYSYDVLVGDSGEEQHVMCFAQKTDVIATFNEAFVLLNLKLVSIIPEALCTFKLFEKTLRKEKKENILYVSYDDEEVSGYLFDSLGLVSKKRWVQKAGNKSLSQILKDKIAQFDSEKTKLNRIILSGSKSDKIRQDTFTKEVGVWTNPIKRIIPHFYQDYLKALITKPDASFPILTYDVCFGAFVFTQENKKFNILKNFSRKGARAPIKIPFVNKKTFVFLLIFAVSFTASFAALYFISTSNLLSSVKLPSFPKKENTSPTPSTKQVVAKEKPTTPTPSFKKDSLRIKVLNGSGTAGKAGQAKDLLSEKGYEEILTGNADTFDYETTIIRVKKSVKDATDVLKKDMSDSVENPKVETLSEDDTSDVIIILGTDFK